MSIKRQWMNSGAWNIQNLLRTIDTAAPMKPVF